MEQEKLLTVTVDGEERRYPFGTPYQKIADDVQEKYKDYLSPDKAAEKDAMIANYEKKSKRLPVLGYLTLLINDSKSL